MTYKSLVFILIFLSGIAPSFAVKGVTQTIPSADGLAISMDLYTPHSEATIPTVVLFHQAAWSRGEYIETAPKLNALGFNAIAVDLRSGGTVNGISNQTAARARKDNLSTTYIDAIPDMIAALEYARKQYPQSKIIVWGSSYSAALVLYIAGNRPELMDGVIAFSPGEYFTRLGKPKTWISHAAKGIEDPTFITSAKNEHAAWQAIYQSIPTFSKQSFLPKTTGHHGSRALWNKFTDSSGYWKALERFLQLYR